MGIVEIARNKRAEYDALKVENAGMKARIEKADALAAELEKSKDTLSSTAKSALTAYGKTKKS